jgi:hypothetical protein
MDDWKDVDSYHPHQHDTASEDAKSGDSGSDSDVAPESDEEERVEPALRTRLEFEIIHRLRSNDIDLGTTKSRSQFLKQYRPLKLASTAKSRHDDPDKWRPNPNILHQIATLERTVDSTPLVRLLLGEFPGLAEDRNKDGKTPLHLALDEENTSFVQAMIEVLEKMDDILNIQDNKGMNCIHAAVDGRIPHALVLDLVRKAPATALRAKNHRGLTPLHLAVRYGKCAAVAQLEIVEELLRRDDGALGVLSNGLTPYQYHLATAERFQKQLARAEIEKSNNVPDSKRKRPPAIPPFLTSASASSDKDSRAPKTGRRKKVTKASQIQDLVEGAARIRDTLKLWVLRTRAEDEARRLLYGSNPESR